MEDPVHQPLLDGPPLPSRIKGRPALIRRIRSLLVAVHRFGRGRARTRADQQWAAQVIDGLTTLLQEGAPDVRNDPR